MPHCPNCASQVDIAPAYKAYNFRGIFVRGQGVRCRSCDTILEFSQWRVVAVKSAPFLLFVPFIWYRDTTVAARIVIVILAVGPLLITTLRLFPGLFQLRIPDPKRRVNSDDELH